MNEWVTDKHKDIVRDSLKKALVVVKRISLLGARPFSREAQIAIEELTRAQEYVKCLVDHDNF